MTGCTIENCQRRVRDRGLCSVHWRKLRVTDATGPLAHEVPPCCVCDRPEPDVWSECRWCARPHRSRFDALRRAWRGYYEARGWPLNPTGGRR